MADIYFKCACGKRLAVDANAVGRMVNCPDCAARFEIPQADFEWGCPKCSAPMSAPEEMCGLAVQCVSCQAEVQVPAPQTPAAPPPGLSLKKNAAPPADHTAGRFNDMLKVCPQCQEQIPINTQGCPFCNFSFSKPKPKRIVLAGLVGLILAGVFLGLWQAKIWPFAAARPSASPPPPAAVPAQPPPASNAVVAAPILEPAGTSAPVAEASVATNAPVTILVETNAVSAEAWRSRFELSRKFMAAQLAKLYPWCATNQFVSLRQSDGLMVRGTNLSAGVAEVTLSADGKTALIAFQNLDAYDRLKVDEEFRSTWIDAQAAALNRWSLEQSGITIPGLASNSDAFLDAALALGDPKAQYQVGEQCYKQKDYAYAFLYWQAAARNYALAQYALGFMCFQGIGVGADKKAGLTWMVLAAAQGQAKAEQFIQQHKLSQEIRQKLVKQEQAHRERESQEWALLIKQGSAARPPPAAAAPGDVLTLDLPVVLTDPATGRGYVYRQGKKTYQE